MKAKKSFYSKAIFFAIFAFINIFVASRSFGYEWSKTFGGSAGDGGISVQQTADGGFIIAGLTDDFFQVYLVKTDGSGNQQWSKTFGGTNEDWGNSVQQTADGGFIVAGSTRSFGAGWEDVSLVKTDGSGNQQWSKTFGGSGRDSGSSVQQTADGGFIVAGSTSSFGAGGYDFYLVKTDGSGNEQWSKTYGGTDWDRGFSVQQTADDGFIIAGHTVSFGAGGYDFYLVKTDGSGNQQWSKTFGGSEDEWGNSVQQTADDGFIIAGYTGSFGAGGSDVYLVKTDGSGNEQWSKTFGGTNEDWGESVQQTADDGFIIAGRTRSFGAGGSDVYLVKTDGSGNEQWSKTFGGTNEDWGNSVQQTTDDGFIIAGYTWSFGARGSDVYLIYYKPDVFVDVPSGYWAEEHICKIYEAGITKGCSKNPPKYCPKKDVTRDQMAAFIVRAVEGEPPANYCGTGSPFSDVAPTALFCKYIKRLSELGITKGCGGGNYCPRRTVTRDQMAAFLVRAVEGEPPADYCDTGSPFSDVSAASVFCKYIKRLSELGITKGCGGGNYCPKRTVKRDQMAVFLGRAFLGMD